MCRDLCVAIERGEVERVKELLDNGSSIHDVEENFVYDEWTPLQFAHRSLKMTRLLLKRGASLDDGGKKTAFHIASEGGHVKVVQYYLRIGTDVDLNGDTGSPLYYASKGGQEETARLLLDRGADIDLLRGWEGDGPLHVACSKGRLNMVELLLDRGADVNCESEEGNRTPLSWACDSGNVEIARLLLNRGAEMDEDIVHSLLAEMWRSLPRPSNRLDLLRLFLDRGANPDARDSNDQTPLMRACWEGITGVCRVLVDRGADVNAVDAEGETPLLSVLLSECDLPDNNSEIVGLLLEQGASVDVRTKKTNETALHIASRRCIEKGITEMLLDKGANLDVRDNDGDTPLHAACETGGLGPAELFLDRGISANLTNGKGKTPLHLSCENEFYYDVPGSPYGEENGHYKITKLLLDKGADVNAKDKDGKTPLHLICELDYVYPDISENEPDQMKIVKLLLDRGADVEAKAKDSSTPLHVACRAKNLHFVWLFVRRYPWLVLDEPCPDDDSDGSKKKRPRIS